MKKGLLSLLALALTVVGCQNYDDQFAELTALIEGVQSDVDGLSDLQSDVDALSSTINSLASAVAANGTAAAANGAAIAANATAIGGLATSSALSTGLAGLQTQIDAINTALQSVASQSDLDEVLADLVEVQADLDELLAANATVSQAILINSSASLQYAESIISTGTDSPNVIVNNTVTIDNSSLTDAEIARANEVAAKIETVIGDVTITGDDQITMSALVYVDGNYVVSGADHSEPKLASITGDLIVTQELAAPLSFDALTSVTNIIGKGSTLATATSIDLSGITVSGNVGTGTVSNSLTATQANGAINLGTIDNFATINANNADSITLASTGAYPTALTINAAVASSISLANSSLGGTLTVVATDTTELNANSLTGTLTANIGTIGTANLDGIAEVTGTLDAEAVSLDGLTHLGASGTIDMDGLTTVNLPNVLVTGSAVGMAAASSVTVKSINDLDFSILTDLPGGVVRTLILAGQTTQVSLTATAQAANLKTLDITLDNSGTGLDLEISATNSLTRVDIAGRGREVNISSNTGLATLTTEGFINDFTANTLAALTSLDIDHTYTSDFTRPFNFDVNNAGSIDSLDLSSLNKVFNLFITNNASLSSITAPANTTPITPDTLNGTIPNIQVTGNSIQATYTVAEATIPSDGINPQTDFVSSTIESASLESIKDFIEANIAVVATTSYTLDWDVHYGGTNASFNAAIIADCDASAGADNTIGVNLTGATCTGATGTTGDDDDRGNINGGYINTSDELAIID